MYVKSMYFYHTTAQYISLEIHGKTHLQSGIAESDFTTHTIDHNTNNTDRLQHSIKNPSTYGITFIMTYSAGLKYS